MENHKFICTHTQTHREPLGVGEKAKLSSRSGQKCLAMPLQPFTEKTVNLESQHFFLQIVKILIKQVSLPSLVTGPHNLKIVQKKNAVKQLNCFPFFNHLAFKWLEGCAIDLKIPFLKMTHIWVNITLQDISSEIFNLKKKEEITSKSKC